MLIAQNFMQKHLSVVHQILGGLVTLAKKLVHLVLSELRGLRQQSHNLFNQVLVISHRILRSLNSIYVQQSNKQSKIPIQLSRTKQTFPNTNQSLQNSLLKQFISSDQSILVATVGTANTPCQANQSLLQALLCNPSHFLCEAK